MLVISRKNLQGLWIGDDVRIVIIENKNGTVRIGIDAPKEIIVDRDEVRQRKMESHERKAA